MREKLKQYIEQLFAHAPKTQSAQELKEEMLQNLFDKYDDLIRAGKSEEDAYAAAIAGIGDVSGLLNGLTPQASAPQTGSDRVVEPKSRQKNPVILAIAIALYVLCIVPNFIFGGVTGVVMMFAMIALATAMFLFNRTVVHPTRSALVGIGVALLILCPTPTMFIGGVVGVVMLFVMIAAGVGLIVYGRSAQFDSVAEPGEVTLRRNAPALGYIAVAALAILLLVGAGISDARRHTAATLHGVTGEIIGGVEEAATAAEAAPGQHTEDKINRDDARDDYYDPDDGYNDHDDYDDDYDDDHDDDDKNRNKNAAVTATIMEGAAEVPVIGITEIEIDWVGGSVQIAPYNGNTIAIAETSDRSLTDPQKLQYTVKGKKLSISYCEETLRVWDWLDIDRLSMPAKSLTVQLPTDLSVELDINSVSAEVAVSGAAFEELDVESVSGDVSVRDVAGRKLDVQTVSGESTLQGVYVSKLDLETTSGDIDVTKSNADEVDVETVSAKAALTLISAPAKLDMETVNGDLTVTLPKDATDFSAHVETVNGNFSCGFASVQQNGRYVVGTGARQYEFTSINGDMQIVAG